MKKALLFGATGFIGSFLLQDLLNDPQYDQVTVVVRKKIEANHPKLKILIGDFNSLPSLKSQLIGDDVFIALGTTRKATPDSKLYYQVDHDYPVLAAKFAKENGATSVSIVTSVGANASSSMFYIRTKGEIERDILALNYAHTNIFRPSMIMGDRAEHRPGEKLIIGLWSVINPLLVGGISHYKGIEGQDIARAMIRAAKVSSSKSKIYHWNEMNVSK